MLYLHGVGHSHPENVISNQFLEELDIGTCDEWITERTGIRERRSVLPLDYIRETRNEDLRAAPGAVTITNAELARRAAEMAIERAGIDRDDIGLHIIEPPFEKVLQEVAAGFAAGHATAVTSNYTGRFHVSDSFQLITALVRQFSATVRWRDNMELLVERGPRVIEIGPGRPLRGFFKTLGVNAESITSVRSAQKILGEG